MPSYAVPISSALIVFAIIAFLGTVPWTIYQYRKFGYFSFWRNAIFFSFIYYCLTAFFLVSLPLPASRNNVEFKNHVYTQFHPFNMLNNFKEIPGFEFNNFKTYPILFKSFTFLEVLFNVALLFPLGVYLRFFFKSAKKWYLALLISFSVTLFFEVSQLTALFGYYAYPYRLFDVDDLMMNTLGGMIGFFTAPLLLLLIPSREQIQKKDQHFTQNKLASYGAQLIEILVTLIIAQFIGSVFSLILFKGDHLFWCNLVSVFFFMVILPLLTNGGTLGGKILKIRINMPETKRFQSLFTRFLLLYGPTLISKLTQLANDIKSQELYILLIQIALFFLTFITWLTFWIVLLVDWIKRKELPFFNRLSKIYFIRK